MRRKIYDKLLEWKKNHKGDTALLIEGARRIGKSYIVEEFARKEYASYILVDFSKVNPQVMEFFNLYLDDLDMLFMNLELYFTVKRKTKKHVPWSYSMKCSFAPVPVQPSSIWWQTVAMITLRQARSFPSRRMSRTSCCLPKNTPSKCFRWILRNFCGLWETRC